MDSMVIHGGQFELLRRVRLPLMRQADPLPAHEVQDVLSTGRVCVKWAGRSLPVPDKAALQAVNFFAGIGAAPVSDPSAALGLKTLAEAGWTFHDASGEIGPYGAYSERKGAQAHKGPLRIDLRELDDWNLALQHPGAEREVALAAGPGPVKVLLAAASPLEAARKLQADKQHEAVIALADTLLGPAHDQPSLDPAARSAVAQARLEFDDRLEAAQAVRGRVNREHASKASYGLLQEATTPLAGLVLRLWPHLGNDTSQELVLGEAVKHRDNPDLRVAGRAMFASLEQIGYTTDAITVAEHVVATLDLPAARFAAPVLDSVSTFTSAGLYRGILAEPRNGREFWLGVLRSASFNEDSGKLTAEAAKQLDPQTPGGRMALLLNYRMGFSGPGKLAVTRAALEGNGTLEATGVKALELVQDSKDRSELAYELAQSLRDLSPSGAIAWKQMEDHPDCGTSVVQAACQHPDADWQFVESALKGSEEFDRYKVAELLIAELVARDEKLQAVLNPFLAFDPAKLVDTLKVYESVRALTEKGPGSGIEDSAEAVSVNGVRLRKRS